MNKSVLGEWKDDMGFDYKFFKNGDMKFNTFGVNQTGKFKMIKKNTIKVDLGGPLTFGGSTTFDVYFTISKMVWVSSKFTMVFEKYN